MILERGTARTIAITRLGLTASDLRDAATQTQDAKASRRMLVIAMMLEGWSREAACAMDCQTLCDWVHCHNELGLEGLSDRPRRNGPQPRLSAEQQAKVAEWVEQRMGFCQRVGLPAPRMDLATFRRYAGGAQIRNPARCARVQSPFQP